MTPGINADQARDIYSRLSRTLCSGDTWRGRAFEMRVAFDLLLNYATNGEIGRSGGFWETAINTMYPGDEQADDRQELNEIRLWFNELQHPLNVNSHNRRYKGYDRRTVLDVMQSLADITNSLSGVPIDPRIIGACKQASSADSYKPITVVFLCELYSRPGAMAEAARLLDALADLPKEKRLRGMGAQVEIHSIVYSPALLQFKAGEDPDDESSMIVDEPADRAVGRAIGTLKAAKTKDRWLIWRTSDPLAVDDETIDKLNEAVEALGISVFPMAKTDEAVKDFKELWPARRVYRVDPMLPDNAVASVLQTIVSMNVNV